MDEQDRQDGVQVSFQSTIVGEFCATLLVEERSLTRTKQFPPCSSMFVFPPPYRFLFEVLQPFQWNKRPFRGGEGVVATLRQVERTSS
jgi:hypothetical protein